MTYIIGLNAYHGDASACLVHDGRLLAAAEEERFRRVKHYAGFPSHAIAYCLEAGGISLKDVDYVGANSDPTANLWHKAKYALKYRPTAALIRERVKHFGRRQSIKKTLSDSYGKEQARFRVCHVEHHLAHLASAFHVSPYENAMIVSIDGLGDFASAAWGIGEKHQITLKDRILFPHSLGIFYQSLTKFLGFPGYGDEYKVMGLAPYGAPRYMDQMREIVRLEDDGTFRLNLDFFWHHRESVEYTWQNGVPVAGRLFNDNLGRLLGLAPRRPGEELRQSHKDLARSIQLMYEEALFHLLGFVHRSYESDTLCLAGGCAMNSVANGKIAERTPYKRVYIQAAAGDAGGAIGAAFQVWHQLAGHNGASFSMDHAYWGPSYSREYIAAILDARRNELSTQQCLVQIIDDEEQLCEKTAEALALGRIVGWFQGRMEWGPRALGNRSILGDPRRSDMKDILNLKIKRRELFRPFAPSILREYVAEWFEQDDSVPFMAKVLQIREDKRRQIPAVTHVDGSGRLQTVVRETNRRYYRLIECFKRKTGVPILLNTSFNENEPIVCRPEEALDCFLRTRMDVLVLGNCFVIRTEVSGAAADPALRAV